MDNIQMVDLKGQYLKIKSEIDEATSNCIASAHFINGPEVLQFAAALSAYLDVSHVIPCANGTDALQVAFMALGLEAGDEVIVPAFTYVATAEVICLMNLKPVMVDVCPDNFNITSAAIRAAITSRTKAIVPVHLFGQMAPMDEIMAIAEEFNLYVIEDTAQAIGATYRFSDGRTRKAGTIGHIGCTSFFPSKNLGCFGDGGAIFTNDAVLAEKIRSIANHGQVKKYVHRYIGVNSRLDTLQAAVLLVKLKYLEAYSAARHEAADRYDQLLDNLDDITVPQRVDYSSHVFHQYTLKVKNNKRDGLVEHLRAAGIPAMIYYPLPLNEQEAYSASGRTIGDLAVTNELCKSVLSLPMHTELTVAQQEYIAQTISEYLKS